jgi:proteasome lid subunit RPN8/RPN11
MKGKSYSNDKHDRITLGILQQSLPQPGLPPGGVWVPGTKHLSYDIDLKVQQAIDEHTYSNREVEVGGILLGEVYQNQGIYFVSVTDVITAQHTIFGPICVKFTIQTWLDIIARRKTCYPDKKTIGWYHSHPGLGVFLSSNDLFIHKAFFGDQAWYIALVVDPISKNQRVFAWDNDQIVRCIPFHSPKSEKGYTL